MADPSQRIRGLKSAPGDFYVDTRCCTACGVPQLVAPDLVGWTGDKFPECYWIRQPSNPEELQRAFAIFDAQELGCHRYAGNDSEIQRRVGLENCGPAQQFLTREDSQSTKDLPNRRPAVWSKKWRRKR